MEAIFNKTGEVINVRIDLDGVHYIDDNYVRYHPLELTFKENSSEPTYWEKLYYQAALMAMQGFLSNGQKIPTKGDEDVVDVLVRMSTDVATAFVKQLKNN